MKTFLAIAFLLAVHPSVLAAESQLAVHPSVLGAESLLPCNVPILDTLTDPTENRLFAFDAVDGEFVTVTVVSTDGAFSPAWRLVDGLGVPTTNCDSFVLLNQDDCGPLLASASPYRVQVKTLSSKTGDFWVHLQRLTDTAACDFTRLGCSGAARTAEIDNRSENDLFAVCGEEGAVFSVSVVSDGGFSPAWRLVDGLGVPATNCDSFVLLNQDDCGPLLAGNSPYRVQVKTLSSDIGGYSVAAAPLFGCVACPCQVFNLEMQMVESPQEFLGCSISAGNDFRIVSPASVVFRAAEQVVLKNDFSVGQGAEFIISLEFP